MTDPLLRYFEADQAPETDLAFRLAVMERMARRRLYVEMAKNVGVVFLLGLGLLIAWPGLNAAFGAPHPSLSNAITLLGMSGSLAFVAYYVSAHQGKWRFRLRLPK